jgi:hypothetical protein
LEVVAEAAIPKEVECRGGVHLGPPALTLEPEPVPDRPLQQPLHVPHLYDLDELLFSRALLAEQSNAEHNEGRNAEHTCPTDDPAHI